MRRLLLLALALNGCARAIPLVKGTEPVVAGTLAGATWLAEDINGGGVIDNARLAVTFDSPAAGVSGRVSGLAGCNRFNGTWLHDGTSVDIGPLASTRRACAPALMDMERKFLGVLDAATAVRFDPTGAAFLTAPDGRLVKLRSEG